MYKKILWLALALLPIVATAQLGNLTNRVKNKLTQRINTKIDKEIDKTLDELEGKTEVKRSTASAETQQPAESKEVSVKSFSKYDFIPGEKIIYTEDFSADVIGELPLHWNSNGKGEVVSLNNFSGKWLKMYHNTNYLTGNKSAFDKNFTVEFDLLLQFNYKSYTFPLVYFGLLSSNDLSTTENTLLTNMNLFQSAEIMLRSYNNNSSSAGLKTFVNKKEFFKGNDQRLTEYENYYNKISHVAMQVQESRLRVWINGQKVVDVPKALATEYLFNQLYFKIGNSGYKENEIGFYISNVKVATGLPDTRHKLIDEGKFSTTGILFDVNAATIKPESAGVLKEIADVLKSNSGIKIKIIGHTDSDGTDAANLELSKRRAEAVKNALVKDWNIDAASMETDGKGETAPVSDNKTKEGKAQNRRVEFIKL